MIILFLTFLDISYKNKLLEDKYMIKKNTKKGEVLKKRYAKNSNVIIGRKTVLDSYYERGYLDLPSSCYSSEDRKKVGEMLAKDYYFGLPQNLKSIDFSSVNIPTTGEIMSESRQFYRERYLRAMQSVPHEFWPSVRRVCLEDKKLICDELVDKNSLRNKNNSYHQKMLLNLGLERLIGFYLKRK